MAKVLIVDDSAFARHRIQKLLEEGGHEVVGSTGEGKDALGLYRELKPDLVTLDHVMDDTPGETAMRSILGFDASAIIIMVSGSNDAALKQRVLDEGAKAFVEKFSPNIHLLEVIDEVFSDPG